MSLMLSRRGGVALPQSSSPQQRRMGVCLKAAANFGNSFDGDALSTLRARIMAQQKREELEKQQERARAMRPVLPEGTKMMHEVEADHSLILRWHAAAWESLAKATQETTTSSD